MFQSFRRKIWKKNFWSKKRGNTEKDPFLAGLCRCSYLIRNNVNISVVQFNSYTILFRIKFYIRRHKNKPFIHQVWLLKTWLSKVHPKIPSGVSSEPVNPEQQHQIPRKGHGMIEHKILYLLILYTWLLASDLMSTGLHKLIDVYEK